MLKKSQFGYRVYKAAIGRRNSWRKPESLSDLGSSYPGYVFGLLKSAEGEILKYLPDLAAADGSIRTPDSDNGEPVLVIADVVRTDRLVRCELVAGGFGDHDDLVGVGVEKIGDRAAGRRFWVDLYFPKTGDFGMVTAEARKNYTPVDLRVKWLAWLDLCDVRKRGAEAEAELAGGLISAEDAAKRTDGLTWRKLRISQVSDGQYLRSLISDANKVTVDLVQTGSTSARGRFREVERKLTVPHVGGGVQDQLATEILSWLDGEKQGAVGRVMSVLKLDRDRLADDGLGFNNTAVHLQANQTVSVTPDSVKDLFTYPLSSAEQPDSGQWERDTRAKLLELAALESVELDL